MTLETNKPLIRQYVEQVWNRADLSALESLTIPDFTYSIGGQIPRDRAGFGQFLASCHAAFPDWRIEINEMIAEGNRVAIHWQGTVTHLGHFNGIPPTGRKIAVSGINIYHIEEGKISFEKEETDTIGMLLQMGVLQPPKRDAVHA